ncbi:MAG: hypothetical protein M0R51_09370 [Clostridia bacterium]|jgi:hypothetical protein|nr:hypothetical protein [Clostridia bacterium]
MTVKRTVNYKVKITTTTVSSVMSKIEAARVAKAAKIEIAKRGVRGAKVVIVKA